MLIRKMDNKIYGLNLQAVMAYHEYHISKTMGIDVLRMDFKEILQNDGIAIKSGLKKFKVPKLYRKSLLVRIVLLLDK